ncbi:hypothetical protein IHE45_19G178500 [Dioscorea alata]|uniref:Uncharacterized protein n=1 Tax=Dioscorea alata TaxID=55571 RepID=A0ACB7U464_DIOAL|nr:hypothetical protein IHE45_19G178500 [Dioscorea alata]
MLRTGAAPPPPLLPLPPKPQHLSRASACLPSPRPISKRKNHLRPKILIPLHSPPPLQPPTPSLIVVHEEEEQVSFTCESPRETVGTDPFPPLSDELSPGSIFGIVLRFMAIFAVQTVVAVLFLGGWDGAETGSDGDRGLGVEAKGSDGGLQKGEEVAPEAVEFEKKVLEIRMMARVAREDEKKELDDGNGGENQVSGGLSELKRRNLMVVADEKASGKRRNGDKSSGLKGRRRSGVLGFNAKGVRDSPQGFNGMKRKDNHSDHMQANILKDVMKSEKRPLQPKPQSLKARQISSTEARRISGSSMRNSQVKEFEGKPTEKKYIQNNNETRPWWMKLPYVLAIFLRRGNNHDSPKGLYSLKKFLPDDGDSPSYTIAFQDQHDATNFCYLLESFFEDLPGFSADVVPLTIQELGDTLKPDDLNLIVVRKGQLQIYAGQPLAEVESALRILLD